MQEETVAVRRKYLEAGLLIHPDSSFPEDHIGAELEFIYYLCQKGAQTEKEEEQKSSSFFSRNFCGITCPSGSPFFASGLFSAARTPYFQGVAKMTQGFILWDFEEVISDFDG